MNRIAIPFLIGLLLIGVFVLVSSNRNNRSKYTNVSTVEAEQLIAAQSVRVIDVREPYEFAAGHIPEAELIPLGSIEAALDNLDREEPYLIVCRSGNRSANAAQIMVNRGFTNVRNMAGGMLAWRGPVAR